MDEELGKAGIEIIEPGFKNMWNPDSSAIEKCIEYGKRIAKA